MGRNMGSSHRRSDMESQGNRTYTLQELCRFIIPSVLGTVIFLLPIQWQGNMTILIGIITDIMQKLLAPVITTVVVAAIVLSAVCSTVRRFLKPAWIVESERWNSLFSCNTFYYACRILGAVFALMVYFGVGFHIVISPDTGGTMLNLLKTITVWFMAAAFLIPLLTDFGIMDYVGTMMRRVTRPVFRLPGRAAVDLLASWLGSNTVGAVLTIKQYERGYYTAREAIVIACCFSAVSLPFSLVIAAMIGVDHLFVPFYLIVTITGTVSAAIMIRIPPLRLYPDEFCPDVGKQVKEEELEGYTMRQWALKLAVEKAAKGPGLKQILVSGLDTFMGIVFQTAPIVMAFGTIACMVEAYTPVFKWLSIPFGFYLQLLGIEDAFSVAPATIIGFIDMFLPSILLAGVGSLKTRFVLGALSLVQIIYITEIGSILISSKVPIRLKDLCYIFIEKTVLALPIIILLTKMLRLF